jgi:hypothetical protein
MRRAQDKGIDSNNEQRSKYPPAYSPARLGLCSFDHLFDIVRVLFRIRESDGFTQPVSEMIFAVTMTMRNFGSIR